MPAARNARLSAASSCTLPSRPAYTGCEQLRFYPALLRGCGSATTHSRRRAGCVCTLTPSSDRLVVSRSCLRSRAACRLNRLRPASAFPRRPLIAGGTVGSLRAKRRERRCRVCLIARAGRTARPGSSLRSSKKRSAPAVGKRAGGRGSSLAPLASRPRPCGRCSDERGSRDQRARP